MTKPSVLLTWAQSLDGRIATRQGESRYISQSGSLELSQTLRRDSDAILVGAGTVLKDDPALTCRIAPERTPDRIVLDSHLRIPADSQLVRTAREVSTAVYCLPGSEAAPAADALRRAGVDIRPVPAGEDGRPSLPAVLEDLAARGTGELMVEGGAAVLTAFVKERLWDRILLVSAPLFLGTGIEALGEIGVVRLDDSRRPRVAEIRLIGDEVVWDLRPEAAAPTAGVKEAS